MVLKFEMTAALYWLSPPTGDWKSVNQSPQGSWEIFSKGCSFHTNCSLINKWQKCQGMGLDIFHFLQVILAQEKKLMQLRVVWKSCRSFPTCLLIVQPIHSKSIKIGPDWLSCLASNLKQLRWFWKFWFFWIRIFH